MYRNISRKYRVLPRSQYQTLHTNPHTWSPRVSVSQIVTIVPAKQSPRCRRCRRRHKTPCVSCRVSSVREEIAASPADLTEPQEIRRCAQQSVSFTSARPQTTQSDFPPQQTLSSSTRAHRNYIIIYIFLYNLCRSNLVCMSQKVL